MDRPGVKAEPAIPDQDSVVMRHRAMGGGWYWCVTTIPGVGLIQGSMRVEGTESGTPHP